MATNPFRVWQAAVSAAQLVGAAKPNLDHKSSSGSRVSRFGKFLGVEGRIIWGMKVLATSLIVFLACAVDQEAA